MNQALRSGLLAAALLAAACAHAPPAVSGPPPSAGALEQRLRAAHREPVSLVADARAVVEATQNGGRYALRLAVQRPSSLRIEALTPLGDPAAILVAHQGRFALLDLRKQVYYRGPATPENLSRLLPAPLTAAELVSLLAGEVPPLAGADPGEVRRDGDAWILTQGAGALAQEARVGADERVEQIVRSAGGRLQWTVKLADHDRTAGALTPRSLHLSVPSPRTEVDLELREVEGDPKLPGAAFRLDPPAGARVEDVR